MNSKTIFTAIGILGFSLAGTASATWEWDFWNQPDNCNTGQTCADDPDYVNLRNYAGTSTTSDPAPGVTATAWSNSEPPLDAESYGQGVLKQRYLGSYGGGLGVVNSSGDGDHEVDNQGWIDSVLLSFDSAVTLSALTFGWVESFADSDFTLAAYVADDGPNNSTDLTQWEYDQLTQKGWEVVGTYFAEGSASEADIASDDDPVTFSVNSGNVSSSYWLVSSLNPKLDNGLANFSNTVKDKFKVDAAAGHAPPQPPVQVPEPSIVPMFLIGMLGAAWMHRRRIQSGASPSGDTVA